MKKLLLLLFSIIFRLYFIFIYQILSSSNKIKLGSYFFGFIKIKGRNNNISLSGINNRININLEGDNNSIIIESGQISNLRISVSGNNHSVIIRAHRGISNTNIVIFDNKNNLYIDEDTGIGGARFVIGGRENYIKLGKSNMISDNVEFWATDSHSILEQHTKKRINIDKPITLMDHVWIGCNVSVLKGVIINQNSIIGMGSVVTTDVPENCVSVGNPNRTVKKNITWCIERL